MQRSGVKVENYFSKTSLNHMTASMSLEGGKKSCFPLLLFCQTLNEKRRPGQVPVSRGGFPDCEPQPQGGEMASSCAEESQRGLHYFSVLTVLPSVSLWSACWWLKTLFRYSQLSLYNVLDYFLQEIWCLIQEFSSGKHKLEVMSGSEEYNPCGLGQKPREMYCDYAWLVLGNQANFCYFFLSVDNG